MMRATWHTHHRIKLSGNPFFRNDRNVLQCQHRRQRFAKIVATMFAIIGIGAILLYHPIFFVNVIQVEGIHSVSISLLQQAAERAMLGRRIFIFPKNNVFFIDRDQIRKNIQDVLFAKNISITPRWGRELLIQVEEYPSVLYWKQLNDLYSINLQGYITEQIPKKTFPLNSTVIEDVGKTIMVGQQALSSEMVQWILNVLDQLKTIMQWTPQTLFPSTTYPEIVQIAYNGLVILFTTTEPIEPQILRLKALIRSKPDLINGKHAIDLRFNEKIYYR